MNTEENATAVVESGPRPLSELETMDDYLRSYGKVLAHKAITSLSPLHVPGVHELEHMAAPDPGEEFDPEFHDLLRSPFEPQKHVIEATAKMMDAAGSGFVVGEMGTGKTLIGMCAVHRHAEGKPYRAIILCPDHLIAKWAREIGDTIPGAIVHRFENWKRVLDLFDKGTEFIKDDGKTRRRIKRWNKPQGAEWYIIGRNQAKWYPEWAAICEEHRGYGNHVSTGHSHRNLIVDHAAAVDDDGKPICNNLGQQKTVAVIAKVFSCPKCGNVIRGPKGIALSAKELANGNKRTCQGFYAEEVADPERRTSGLDRITSWDKDGSPVDGKEISRKGKKYVVRQCNEPLWNFTRKMYRWAPAWLVQRKLRKMFKYLIIDEVHEQKSDESAQSHAAGKLMAATKHTLALTGTLIGGYARDLFPLMLRMTPTTLKAEGFAWGKTLPFSRVYGRIDRVVTTKMGEEGGSGTARRTVSMRKAQTGKAEEKEYVRPGIMPTMFGRHLIGSSMFITLEELADELPDLDEYVEDGACDMDEDQRREYKIVEEALDSACKELLKKGSMKLLGAKLQTLLAYPDKPHGWVGDHDGELTVGYYDKPKDFTQENWRGVVSPANLCPDTVRPKEQKLVDICTAEVKSGRQCWVFVQMTQKRNVQPRLKTLLEAAGLRVKILPGGSSLKPVDREAWIEKNGPNCDVIISHPKPVSTGLDFFAKDGAHNFSTIIFYETGYSLFDMRQASRRAWRIGQPLGCKVYYLYYRETMQHLAMSLMSRKMAAAAALEGEFSTEGLVAMAGEDNAQMALARTLSAKIDDKDMQRSWSKVKSGAKKKARPERIADFNGPLPVVLDSYDALPMTVQLAALSLVGSPLPEFNPPAPKKFGPTLDLSSVAAAKTAAAKVDTFDDLPVFGSLAPAVAKLPVLDVPAVVEEAPLPMLSREALAKMFQALVDDGMSLDDFN